MKILSKIKNKILDFFDVIKYKRIANTWKNKYDSQDDEIKELYRQVSRMEKEGYGYRETIIKQKLEIKELKKKINEGV